MRMDMTKFYTFYLACTASSFHSPLSLPSFFPSFKCFQAELAFPSKSINHLLKAFELDLCFKDDKNPKFTWHREPFIVKVLATLPVSFPNTQCPHPYPQISQPPNLEGAPFFPNFRVPQTSFLSYLCTFLPKKATFYTS